jgi:hypothetical protein
MIKPTYVISVWANDKNYKGQLSGDTAFIIKDFPNDTSLFGIVSLYGSDALDATVSLGNYSEYSMQLVNPGDLNCCVY